MNRVVVLMSLLLAIISAYGQQGTQWYDVSNFAPSVKQCQISLTNERLYVYVYTGDKDVYFWVEEPQRTGALMVLNGNDLMEYRQAFFNEFITEALNSLPPNATVQPHVQQRTEYEVDPLENLEIDVQPVDKELLEKGLSNEEIADYYAKLHEDSRTTSKGRNTDNAMSGVMQQSISGQLPQQGNREESQSEGSSSGLDGFLENILLLVIGCWILKAILKGFFGSSNSSSKKNSSDKNYEDGPAWFHDHGQNI